MVDTNLNHDVLPQKLELITYKNISAISAHSGNSGQNDKAIDIDRRKVSGSVFDIDENTFQTAMPRSSHWSIAWSDLMMTMFVLFLSMFVYQTAHQEFLKPGTPEIIGGDTTEALQVINDNRATLPLDPAVHGLPLITAGTIRKVEPAPSTEKNTGPVPSKQENGVDPSSTQEMQASARKPESSAEQEISKVKVVFEPQPLMTAGQPPSQNNFQEIYRLGKGALNNNNLKRFAAIDLVPDKTMRIILTGDLIFEIGDSELSTNAQQSLQKVTGFLKNTPYMINIAGHTDNVPMHSYKYASNWELSVNRATRVARFLIDEIGMNPNQLVVSGYSSFRPMVPNTTAENRAKNRRVEIIVSKRLPEPSPLNSQS